MGRLVVWVIAAALVIIVGGAIVLMVATPKAGTERIEKVVPLEKLAS